MNKLNILNEIKAFLDGYNDDLKYLVNVETDPNVNYAECIVHPPDDEKQILKVEYTPFMYMRNLKRYGYTLYNGDKELQKEKMRSYKIKIEKLKTGNQKRLEDGFCYKISSTKSYNSIIRFLRDGGLYPYEKSTDDEGNIIKDNKGNPIYLYRHLFNTIRLPDQFLIAKKARLFKGFEEYKDVHRVTFDIESTGLRPEISRVFAIGVRDNRGFETILEVDKENDDLSEVNLIRDFFNLIDELKPAVIVGHNSEEFDFYYILGRANILNMDLDKIPTTLRTDKKLKRKPNSTVKIGNGSEKYTATEIWGISVIDTLHAAKQTAAMNSDLKKTNLKYIAKFEKIAKDNRTHIPGEDNDIGRYYHENPIFLANDENIHIEIPKEFQETANKLYIAQQNKDKLTDKQYLELRNHCLKNNPQFVKWYKKEALSNNMTKFIKGKTLLRQYLLDDLYETEQVDELYNQSTFMLSKIVPTTYQKVSTMGTASIWNLLLTAWSYEKGIAIPYPDSKKKFSGGLARCYKSGYTKRLAKIDYASLYPMLQLTWDIFPLFDITGVMKKMLIYMTTTRNIYKKLGKSIPLESEEKELLKGIDHETYDKYIHDNLSEKERSIFNVKQLPIKILNNSQFGALGSDISFNWSDNMCAARITTSGRLELRHAISWFNDFGLTPLLAVTDGVNFHVPDYTYIIINENGVDKTPKDEAPIEEMWKYKGKVGLNAIIEYFNDTEMKKPYMLADNDGEFVSCLNLSRINYALLEEREDKKTGEKKKKIKLTGNTIKSKVLPEYIEEFIDNGLELILEGKGHEFVEYYYDYVENLYYRRIPLKKIASKSKYKQTLKDYLNRGVDKNGRVKGKQAHMELILEQREKIAEELFEKHKDNLNIKKNENELTIQEKMKLVDVYMPPEPELDSTIYYVNTGYRKSHGDSQKIKDKKTGEYRYAASLIDSKDVKENPNMLGEYNVDKYLDAFNKRVKTILVGFDPEIAEKIPANIVRKKIKDKNGKSIQEEKLERNYFTKDQLKLRNFDKDDLDESMYLEEKEVKFWNESGFDPRLVWNGFKMYDDMKVYYEIYENALNYLNNKMKKAGKSQIKSRNEKIEKGDYVLLKNGGEYNVGYNNGQFIQIIRSNVEIPKSNIEIELDKKKEEEKKKKEEQIDKLKDGIGKETDTEKKFELQMQKRTKYFPQFKKKFNLPEDMTYSSYQQDSDGMGDELLDKFIDFEEKRIEEEKIKYLGID